MIRLKNIRKQNSIITCDAYIEDCKEPVTFSMNADDPESFSVELPEGYEWCKSHVFCAKRFLASLANAERIPEQKTIAWG